MGICEIQGIPQQTMRGYSTQAEIERVIGGIGPQMCEKVISNFEKHINACRLSAGGYMTDIPFIRKWEKLLFISMLCVTICVIIRFP